MFDKVIQEKCGLVAIYTPKSTKLLNLGLSAAGGVQHRGQHGAGLAMQTKEKLLTYFGNGLVKDVFNETVINRLNKPSLWTLVHCRYGTYGGYLKENLQPCIAKNKTHETIAVIHNGEFAAPEKIREKIKGNFPPGISDTYLFAQLLSQSKGASWEEKLLKAFSEVNGAYSLAIGIGDKLFLARDEFGIRPFVLGKLKNKWVAVSETHALDKIGAEKIREIKRGEIIRIDKGGVTSLSQGVGGSGNFCDFEWAYFSRPNSMLPTHEDIEDYKFPKDWLSVTVFRERCGEILSTEKPFPQASFVVGLPDSGVAVGTGYANKLKLPYRQVIIRDHFDRNGQQRLFMRDDQMQKIKRKVLGKLSFAPDKQIWGNAIVVVCDDSIIRGNVTKQITKAIFALGAKEVHWIIGFPPVTHRCHLGVSIRTHEELIAAQYNGDPKKVAKKIKATSVYYISPQGFNRAKFFAKSIKLTDNPDEVFLANGGCGGCVTGLHPIDRKGKIYKLEEEKKTIKRLAVLISNAGTGTNLQAIIDGVESGRIKAEIAVVISDTSKALGLNRARKYHLPITLCPKKELLLGLLQKYEVNYVCLAGWKQIITQDVIDNYRNKIFNTHPGIIPNKKGGIFLNPDGTKALWNKGKFTDKAMQNIFDNKATYAGCSNHFLTHEFDFGPVLGRCFEKVQPDDNIETLYSRLKKKENEMYIKVLAKICNEMK